MGTRSEYESLQREYASVCGSLNGANNQYERLEGTMTDLNTIKQQYEDISDDLDDAKDSYNKNDYLWFGTLYDSLMGSYRTSYDVFTPVLDEIIAVASAKKTSLEDRIDSLEAQKGNLKSRINSFVIEEDEV